MTIHVRSQVKTAFVALVTGLATTAARVFPERDHMLADLDMPALRVYTTDEHLADSLDNQSTDAATPYLQKRDITLVCEALAMANAELEDTLVEIQKEIEIAVAGNPTLGGIAKLHCRLKSAVDAVGYHTDVAAGQNTLTFTVTVFTMSNAPDVAV